MESISEMTSVYVAYFGGEKKKKKGRKKKKVKLFLTVLDFSGASMLLQPGEI